MLTGKILIEMGYTPAPWFKTAIASGRTDVSYIESLIPPPPLPLSDTSYDVFIDGETEAELDNIAKVHATMRVLMRTPTLTYGAVMPDACPAGSVGTIPVGGVVVAKNAIHPGMHSADICCSLRLTEFEDISPAAMLTRIHEVTHFGPGGRPDFEPPAELMTRIAEHPLLSALHATEDFGTQGDGNHFAYVGVSENTGNTCLVTHHGSRRFGAQLYKHGMRIAEKFRMKLSPDTLKQNAWIPADSDEGRLYWEALQIVREWTRHNHDILHAVAGRMVRPVDSFWNEHNFVFQDGDDYIHAKGSTPLLEKFVPGGRAIIPLNMIEPILIVRNHPANTFGFAPHGAGRNTSRTKHSSPLTFEEETAGIDARFYSGVVDMTELPSAYKSASEVTKQIEHYALAQIVNRIIPHGCIMAGAGNWKR